MIRTSLASVAMLLAFAALPLLSQAPDPSSAGSITNPLAWDAVSVKPNRSLSDSAMTRILPNGYQMVNMSIHSLVMNAFDIRSGDQITGWPSWTNSDRFDVLAKMDAESAAAFEKLHEPDHSEQWRLLMLQILVERFALKFHVEQRVLPVLNMVVAKKGLKLKPSAPGTPSSSGMSPGKFSAKAIPAGAIVGSMADRMTFDKTGLTGLYDVELTWAWNDDPNSTAPPFFTAIEEQLGLKLEAAKAPVDVVVLDCLERPSEN